jgi:hypothetical protein
MVRAVQAERLGWRKYSASSVGEDKANRARTAHARVLEAGQTKIVKA